MTAPSSVRCPESPFAWTRHSLYLLSAFLMTVGLIIYVWWPLAEEYLAFIDWGGPWWRYFDWLLVGIFLVMSLLIMARADLRTDWLIIFVGAFGGLAIESWGTQTNLWFYYTHERPPLWIIPAWPIASLSIDRLTRLLDLAIPRPDAARGFRLIYWIVFGSFYALMLVFVFPTFDKSFTVLAALLCAFLILTPTDHRLTVLTFAAGSGLGYFLELWGTTRQCWTYYTYQTPPLFAVLAHGLAAVAFWRAGLLIQQILSRLRRPGRDFPASLRPPAET
jgi:hypothetical protein